jgi:ABC-type dipeptide/oligopeptide/nickel transport system ATPase component
VSGEASAVYQLQVDNLEVDFATKRGNLRAVDGVSLDLVAGQTIGIVGESGSGKSVLCKAIMGILPATATVSEAGRRSPWSARIR